MEIDKINEEVSGLFVETMRKHGFNPNILHRDEHKNYDNAVLRIIQDIGLITDLEELTVNLAEIASERYKTPDYSSDKVFLAISDHELVAQYYAPEKPDSKVILVIPGQVLVVHPGLQPGYVIIRAFFLEYR